MKAVCRRERSGASAEIADRPEREARGHDEDVANCRLMGGVGAEVVLTAVEC
jgi:hypothetical protein